MRIIKFRAWNKRLGHMLLFPYQLTFSQVDGSLEKVSDYQSEQYELMQFTGLLDKNGVEIYEGDVVAYKTFFYGNEKDHKKEVKWEQWTSDNFGEPDCIGYFNLDSVMEVIGNIHENPDLLEKGTHDQS